MGPPVLLVLLVPQVPLEQLVRQGLLGPRGSTEPLGFLVRQVSMELLGFLVQQGSTGLQESPVRLV